MFWTGRARHEEHLGIKTSRNHLLHPRLYNKLFADSVRYNSDTMLYTPISRTLHADWLHAVGQYFTCRVASLEAASRMVWTFIKLNEGLAHDGFDAHWLSTATEITQSKAWSSIFYQAWCCCSSICMAVGCFLNLEGFKERCPQLIPLLPDHHTLVSNKLAAIHHPIRLQLVPQPLRKVPHVLTQVELLMRFETGPRHQAEMFASCNSDRVFTRLALRDHGVPAIEALQSQDRVHVGISGSQVSDCGAVQHFVGYFVEHICETRIKMVKPKLPICLQVYWTRGPNDSDWPNLAHGAWSKSLLMRSRYSLLAQGNPCKAGVATTQGACDRSGTRRSHDSCQKGPWLNWVLRHRACDAFPQFPSHHSVLSKAFFSAV